MYRTREMGLRATEVACKLQHEIATNFIPFPRRGTPPEWHTFTCERRNLACQQIKYQQCTLCGYDTQRRALQSRRDTWQCVLGTGRFWMARLTPRFCSETGRSKSSHTARRSRSQLTSCLAAVWRTSCTVHCRGVIGGFSKRPQTVLGVFGNTRKRVLGSPALPPPRVLPFAASAPQHLYTDSTRTLTVHTPVTAHFTRPSIRLCPLRADSPHHRHRYHLRHTRAGFPHDPLPAPPQNADRAHVLLRPAPEDVAHGHRHAPAR
eukprot:IDg88t1